MLRSFCRGKGPVARAAGATGLTLTVFLLATPSFVGASPAYPAALHDDLKLDREPSCAVCHEADDAGFAADTAFARALIVRGLLGRSVESLRAALIPMVDVDSDGDGARDLDELSWGGDPNTPEGPAKPPDTPPSYGCTAARSFHASGIFALGSALALFIAYRLRRPTFRAHESHAPRGDQPSTAPR